MVVQPSKFTTNHWIHSSSKLISWNTNPISIKMVFKKPVWWITLPWWLTVFGWVISWLSHENIQKQRNNEKWWHLSALILFLRSHLSSLLLFLCFLVICSYIFLCKTDCFSDCINYHFINNNWICFYFHIRSINLSLLCHILIHEIKKVLDPWKKNYDKARKYVKRQRHHFVDRGLL